MSETPNYNSDLAAELRGQLEQDKVHRNEEMFNAEAGHKPWTTYDSGLNGPKPSFNSSFDQLVPVSYRDHNPIFCLQHYIEATLRSKEEPLIALEIGGPGRMLFRDFTRGFFEKTAGIVLFDAGGASESIHDLDKIFNHTVIEGNIFNPKIKSQIREWSGGSPVDLIIERMVNGLGDITLPLHHITRQLQW